MRRRLDLAASLVGRPSVIFLDEPTTGLDPAKREDMWEVVRRLVTDGSTVLLTTQYLDEADALADEITVIDHGRVIAHDTPDGAQAGRRRPDARGPAERTEPGPRRPPRFSPRSPAAASGVASARHAERVRPGRLRAARDCGPPRRRPASPSPSSPFTCPAWTRCSSPSPGAARATTRSQSDTKEAA